MQRLRKYLKENSVFRKLALAILLMMAFLVALPASSLADSGNHGHGKQDNHKHGSYHGKPNYGGYSRHGHGSGQNWGGNAYFGYRSVPRRIYVENRSYYQPFYSGTVFYGPHRHYHRTYSFPVYVNNAVVYRPYYYCGDQVFVSAPAPLPRLAFGFGFGFPAYGGYVTYQHQSYDNPRYDDDRYDDRSCQDDDCYDQEYYGD